jgi:hypothetical protein
VTKEPGGFSYYLRQLWRPNKFLPRGGKKLHCIADFKRNYERK